MNIMQSTKARRPAYFHAEDCSLEEFAALTAQTLSKDDLTYASSVEKNIPVYVVAGIEDMLSDPSARQSLMAEWAHVLMDSAGVLVLKGAYRDTAVIDEATALFDHIIATEKKAGGGADHFAKAGANDRIWNSLQKLCAASPDVFARYHAVPAIDAVCEAWLGPNYQMTAQVNLVRPGGEAQQAHRDYHLGFQTAEISATYPAHVHLLSPVMTLQGGIAHVDIPVEAGPTKLLPFSQAYAPGYAAWRRDDFRQHFEDHHVQLPLAKGDAIFFNPALFHAGGANRTSDVQRLVNLLQVSSALGRAMETIDRGTMCRQLFPVLKSLGKTMSQAEIDAAVSASAEGYSFPTNLDNDPPVGGLAPVTQKQLLVQALDENWSAARFDTALSELLARQQA